MKFPFGEKQSMHALSSGGPPPRPPPGCVPVPLCTSIVGFAFWTVVGVDACPDLPCSEIVPPQLPLLIILSLVLEFDTGLRQELLIDAAWLRLPPVCLANASSVIMIGVVAKVASRTNVITIVKPVRFMLRGLQLGIIWNRWNWNPI